MTTERKKALLMMGATFVIGILIGVLGTGFFARHYYHGRDGRRPVDKEMSQGPRKNFITRIYRVVKADSSQAKLMKPILQAAMTRIDSLQEAGDRDAQAVMDGMKQKLVPILKPEQIERLEKFSSRKHRPGSERRDPAREHKRD